MERPYDGDGDMIALPDIGAFEWPSAEVLDLVFIGPDTMTWQVDNASDVYNVYRGGISRLQSSGDYTQPLFLTLADQFCEFPASALPFTDAFDPGFAESVAYYLVTRRGAAFEGSLGNDWVGALRPNDHACP